MARMARPLTQAAQSSVTAQATHSLRSEETSIPNGMNDDHRRVTVLPSRLDITARQRAARSPLAIRQVIGAY